MLKRLLVAAFVTAFFWQAQHVALAARETGSSFAGIEFYGSDQVTRLELEKLLGLKPGAGYEATAKAASRLQEKLEQRRIKAHVDMAADDGRLYITVDVLDTGVTSVPIRKLENPHRVYLSTDVPFQLFDQLLARREQLAAQDRPVTETFDDGMKHFSDEPCNQIGEKLKRMVPAMRDELLTVIASDPDPVRRSKAIEVLNWDPDVVANCAALLPSIDDGSEQVRVSAARYILPRMKMLPDNFPMPALVESFSHELQRPAHIDRLLALRCLSEIVRTHPWLARAVKEADEDKLKQLDSMSVLGSIKQPAEQLLNVFAQLPDESQPGKHRQVNEF